jgi:hypothetical protein
MENSGNAKGVGKFLPQHSQVKRAGRDSSLRRKGQEACARNKECPVRNVLRKRVWRKLPPI